MTVAITDVVLREPSPHFLPPPAPLRERALGAAALDARRLLGP